MRLMLGLTRLSISPAAYDLGLCTKKKKRSHIIDCVPRLYSVWCMRIKDWSAAAVTETIHRLHSRVWAFLGEMLCFILDHQSTHLTLSPKSHPMSQTPFALTYVGSWVQIGDEALGLDPNRLRHLPLSGRRTDRSCLTVFSVRLT